MGGFDIYYAKGSFSLNDWEKPINAGAPLNSSKDDIYFVSTDEDDIWNTGWMSSDRSSECCLALFSVKGNNAKFVNGPLWIAKHVSHSQIPSCMLLIFGIREGYWVNIKQMPPANTHSYCTTPPISRLALRIPDYRSYKRGL